MVDSGSTTVRFVIYSDTAGDPDDLLAQSDSIILSGTSMQAREFTFSGAQRITLTEGTDYWIGLSWQDPGSASVRYWRVANNSNGRLETNNYLPDPFNEFGAPNGLSGPLAVHVTYATEPDQVEKAGSDTAAAVESGSVGVSGSETAVGVESGYVAEQREGDDTAAATAETGDTSATSTSGETAAGEESYDTSATITPDVEDIAVGAESGFIAIPGEDIADATDAHDPPPQVTATTGQTALGHEGGHAVPPYAELILALFAVDPEDGTLTVLPDYKQLRLSRTINAKGAIQVDYPADGRNFDLLRGAVTDNRDLEIEIWSNGSPAGALRGYLQEASGDDVAEDGNWTFAGSFLEVRTDETIIYPQDRGEQ